MIHCNWIVLDLLQAGAASLDVVDQPTKPSTAADGEDTWDDTESDVSEQQSKNVKHSHCGLCDSVAYSCFLFLCTLPLNAEAMCLCIILYSHFNLVGSVECVGVCLWMRSSY